MSKEDGNEVLGNRWVSTKIAVSRIRQMEGQTDGWLDEQTEQTTLTSDKL